MPDIYLYAGEIAPNDVKLRDPTILAGGSALTQSFNDSFALSDASALLVTLKPSDAFTLADAAVLATFLAKADTFALSDTAIRTIQMSKSDSYTVVDGFSHGASSATARDIDIRARIMQNRLRII